VIAAVEANLITSTMASRGIQPEHFSAYAPEPLRLASPWGPYSCSDDASDMSRQQLSEYPIVFDQPKRIASYPFWVEHIPFAFFLVDCLRPRLLVELGVQSGNSFNAFCQAVKTLEAGTKCYGIDTWKGDEHSGVYDTAIFSDLQAYQQREYGEFASLLRMTFDEAVPYFSDGSVDLLHIDGYHAYEAVREDFDTWLPKMSDQGVILFHDIAVRERGFGVWRLWEELSPRYPSLAFQHGHGLGVLAVGARIPEDFRVLLAEFQANGFYHHLFFRLGHHLALSERCRELEADAPGPDGGSARTTRDGLAQLYFDAGLGFNELHSVTVPVESGANRIEFHVEASADVTRLRLDPLNDVVAVSVKAVDIVTDQQTVPAPPATWHNASYLSHGCYLFASPDPQIAFDLVSPARVRTVIVEMDVLSTGADTYRQILDMKDTELSRPARKRPYLIRGLHRVMSLLQQHTPRLHGSDGDPNAPGSQANRGSQAYQIPLEPWHLSFVDSLLQKIPLKNSVVLDIGCGRGEVAREVIRRVGEVTVHGIDSDLCGLAELKNETANRLTIRRMDVKKLAFPDACFDAAYSLNVFEHINDLESTYRELRRVLKPGGRLYIYSSPIWTSYRGHHFNHWLSDYVDLVPPWGHLHLTRDRLFEEIVRKKGFAVAEEAMQYIFESNYLNRVSLSEHKRLVRESGFQIIELAEMRGFEFIEPPSAEYIQNVADSTGLSQDELTVDAIGLLLERA